MKRARRTGLWCALGATVVLLTAAATSNQQKFIEHKIVEGESVSLLCIQYYGYYSPTLGKAFLKDNPDIDNINVIYAGQTVRLRNPQGPKSTTAKAREAKERPLFEKRVNATQGVVTYLEGDVSFVPFDRKKTMKLSTNTLVYPGDVIKTGDDGRVEVIINRETVVRMKENTQLTIEAFRHNAKKKGTTRMSFSVGSVWSKVKKFKDKVSRFELELPTAIAGVHGTVYQAEIAGDASAEVKVYDGQVAVRNSPHAPTPTGGVHEVSGPDEVPGPHEVSVEEWIRIVRGMQKVKIDKDGKPSSPQSFSRNPKDDWERWNAERDKRIARMFAEI